MAPRTRRTRIVLTDRDWRLVTAILLFVAASAVAGWLWSSPPWIPPTIALLASGIVLWFYYWERVDRSAAEKSRGQQVQKGTDLEQFIPILPQWPWPKERFTHVGGPHPFDGIQLTDDELIFVEIKTGGTTPQAGLKPNERIVRDAVRFGRVRWRLVRLNEKGLQVFDESGKSVTISAFPAAIEPGEVAASPSATSENS